MGGETEGGLGGGTGGGRLGEGLQGRVPGGRVFEIGGQGGSVVYCGLGTGGVTGLHGRIVVVV